MSERPVVIGAGSFSVDSGGRTTASFTRASVLAESGWKVTIATTNFKVEYGRIFESWAGRFGVRGLVDHANFFEWCAGTQLYSIEEEHVEFPPPGAEATSARVWSVAAEDGTPERYICRNDGSLLRMESVSEADEKCHATYDRSGNLRVQAWFSDPAGPRRVRLSAPDGHVFATTDRGEDGIEWIDCGLGREKTDDARGRWMANIARTSLVLIDDRAMDELCMRQDFDSTLRDRSAAVLHSSHLRRPFSGVRSVAPYNGRSLKRGQELGGFVFLTRRQQTDIESAELKFHRTFVIPNLGQESHARARVLRRSKSLVMLTRLVPVKRIDHAIRAFREVVDTCGDAQLTIYGEGPLRKKLKTMIRDLQLENNVSLPGHVSDPAAALVKASAVIVSSEAEGYSFAILEALRAGVPVISYDLRYGPSEMIRSGVNGYLVAEGSTRALAVKILKVHRSRGRRLRLNFGARFVSVGISRQEFSQRWSEVLEYLAVRAGRKPVDEEPPALGE